MNTNVVMRKRIARLFLLMAGVLFFLCLRLGWIQFVKGDWLQEKSLDNRLREVKVEAKRGVIYDRNGKELAISISTDSVGAFPAEVKRGGQAEATARQLAEILEMDAEKILAQITSNNSFVWIKRKIGFEQGPKIKELDLPGIEVFEESQRYYPHDLLASHVLGFAGIDNQGLEGLEKKYDQVLRGQAGRIIIEFDGVGKEIPQAVHQYIPPSDGYSLVLTLDETIQYLVERELDLLMEGPSSPKSASIIVMDPKTGDILGMASRATFNPNNFASYPQSSWRNIAVSNTYEPGSTFKIITAAAALEEKVVSSQDRFYDPGYFKIGKETIKCWRTGRPHGSQTFTEGVENSCNPVFVEVGLRLEEKEKNLFYKYIRAFGFGEPTGIDLFGEARGILISEDKIKLINIGTISIGQGIAVTPLQLTTAAAAVANGGYLLQPRLVKEIRDNERGLVEKIEPRVVRQVISQETARELALILEGVVSKGTGRNAYIPGFRVGGKTGTAQKAGKGGYQPGKYVASFIGLAPVNDPRLVTLVVIDEPQGVYYGGQLAAPIFRKVMEDSLHYLGVAPQYSSTGEEKPADKVNKQVTVPDVTNLTSEQARAALQSLGLNPIIQGQGPVVVDQTPKGMARIDANSKVILRLGTPDKESSEVKVPDLTGYRIFEAARVLEAFGLIIKPEGNGTALEQEPVPGSLVLPGTAVKVKFGDEETKPVLGP